MTNIDWKNIVILTALLFIANTIAGFIVTLVLGPNSAAEYGIYWIPIKYLPAFVINIAIICLRYRSFRQLPSFQIVVAVVLSHVFEFIGSWLLIGEILVLPTWPFAFLNTVISVSIALIIGHKYLRAKKGDVIIKKPSR